MRTAQRTTINNILPQAKDDDGGDEKGMGKEDFCLLVTRGKSAGSIHYSNEDSLYMLFICLHCVEILLSKVLWFLLKKA